MNLTKVNGSFEQWVVARRYIHESALCRGSQLSARVARGHTTSGQPANSITPPDLPNRSVLFDCFRSSLVSSPLTACLHLAARRLGRPLSPDHRRDTRAQFLGISSYLKATLGLSQQGCLSCVARDGCKLAEQSFVASSWPHRLARVHKWPKLCPHFQEICNHLCAFICQDTLVITITISVVLQLSL